MEKGAYQPDWQTVQRKMSRQNQWKDFSYIFWGPDTDVSVATDRSFWKFFEKTLFLLFILTFITEYELNPSAKYIQKS